jgi:FkbM family methyltransferase
MLGIDKYFQRAYRLIGARLTPDEHHIDIDGASATFETRGLQEYRRVTKFTEPEVLKDFVSEIRPDDVVWDVGANTGIYTCIATDVLTEGCAVAIEPHPGNLTCLRRNVATTHTHRVDVWDIALSDEDGTAELYMEDPAGGHGLHSLGGDIGETVEIETRRGDSLVADGEPVPAVVKIDVEGAEGQVIEGMMDVLSDPTCRVVYCEVHADRSLPNSVYDFGYRPEEVERLIETAGFSRSTIDDGDRYMIKATRPE